MLSAFPFSFSFSLSSSQIHSTKPDRIESQPSNSVRSRRPRSSSPRVRSLARSLAMSSSTASWSRYGAVPASPPPVLGPMAAPEADGNGEAPSSSSPPATAAEAGVAFFSRARVSATAAAVGRPRAWREVLDLTAFSRPESCGEARARARRNLAYFRANYALAALLLVFLGLVYRPRSMLAFLALFVAWLALYFGRGEDDPLVCLRREVDDRLVLALLAAATVLAVALTRAGLNLLVSLVLASAVIGVHAAFRMNVYLDERDAFDGAVSSFTGSTYGYSTLPR